VGNVVLCVYYQIIKSVEYSCFLIFPVKWTQTCIIYSIVFSAFDLNCVRFIGFQFLN
jgi:hypothetical protein